LKCRAPDYGSIAGGPRFAIRRDVNETFAAHEHPGLPAAAYGHAMFNRSLRRKIVFSDHSLATDGSFAEMQLISCRNVMIYFDRVLQERALGLTRACGIALPRIEIGDSHDH
jgi:hypothetical protein